MTSTHARRAVGASPLDPTAGVGVRGDDYRHGAFDGGDVRAVVLSWAKLPLPGETGHDPTTVLPAGVRVAASRIERRLRSCTDQPLSADRVLALMCLVDRAAATAGAPPDTGLRWGYRGWGPRPVGPAQTETNRSPLSLPAAAAAASMAALAAAAPGGQGFAAQRQTGGSHRRGPAANPGGWRVRRLQGASGGLRALALLRRLRSEGSERARVRHVWQTYGQWPIDALLDAALTALDDLNGPGTTAVH